MSDETENHIATPNHRLAMRPHLAVLVALVTIALLLSSSGARAAHVPDPGSAKYANQVLTGFGTPTLTPGESGTFSFKLFNPYPGFMVNVTLTADIYKYATSNEARFGRATRPPSTVSTTSTRPRGATCFRAVPF